MPEKKNKTYMDELMQDKEFKKLFDEEYQKLLISEKIAKLRKESHLTQKDLASRIHTTKSAISCYESAGYRGYSITILFRIARACGADLKVNFVPKKKHKSHKEKAL